MTSAALDRMSIARDTSVAAGAFGLATAPFEAGPDPRFVYPHLGLQRVCAELLAFDLSERPSLLVITGAAGTGKSTLLRSILEDRRLGEHSHALSCAGGLSFEALVEAWCAALRIARKARAHETRRSALAAHLAAQSKKARAAALLLDDAEALDDRALGELRELAGAGAADRRLVRIVLAGRPELAARLARPELAALGQAIAFQTSLEAMSEAEVGAYIRHRLAVAGHEAPDELFSAQAVEIVARASLGVPRVINVLCRTALAIGQAGGRAAVSAEQVEAAIQACMLHAQDSLAAQTLLPLPDIPAAGGVSTVATGPGPPRPDAHWPMVVDIEPAADGVSRADPSPRRRPHRLLRSAPGLLVGAVFGLAVVTLFPARLETPEAVPPGLLLSDEDDKARMLESGPAPESPAETRAPEAKPIVLDPEPPDGPRKIEPMPAVPAPEPPVETRAPEAEPTVPDPEPPRGPREIEAAPAVPAPETPVETRTPGAESAVRDREPWTETRAIEAEPAVTAVEAAVETAAPEAEPAVPDRERRTGTLAIEAEPAVPAPELAVETRTIHTAPVVPAPEPPGETPAPEAKPAVLAPKPPVKPRLFPARGKPAAAASFPEAPNTVAEPGPTSWLGSLADLVRSAEPPREPRRLERQTDR